MDRKLRDADAMLNSGKDLAAVLQALEISATEFCASLVANARHEAFFIVSRRTAAHRGQDVARDLLYALVGALRL